MSVQKLIRICDKVIEFCFYSLLIAVTFSISLVEIAASLMIVAWLVKKAANRDFRFIKQLPFILMLAFFLWNVLSCFNSAYCKESFRGILKIAEYLMLFLIAATHRWEGQAVKRALVIIGIVAIIVCTSGIFQHFSGFDFIRNRQLIHQDYMRRISSSFIHPNDFGVYLLVVSIIFISVALSGLKYRWLALVPLAFSLVCLFLTRSRGAWLSFSAALVLLGTMKSRKVAAVILTSLLVIFLLLPGATKQRIFSLADVKSGTTWERVMLWKGTVNMIKVHPVLGFGVNTFSRNFPKYKPPEYPDLRYTHNSYLQMASEIGVVGAVLFLIFLLTVLFYSLKGIRSMKEGMRKILATGLFAGIVGFSLNCAVDTHLFSVNPAVFFYTLLGFCFSLSTGTEEL